LVLGAWCSVLDRRMTSADSQAADSQTAGHGSQVPIR
jgi:hypothetical protein